MLSQNDQYLDPLSLVRTCLIMFALFPYPQTFLNLYRSPANLLQKQ